MSQPFQVIVVLGIAVGVSATMGCNSGGDGGVISQPPADVAGIWDTVATNAGSSILTGCTGDFASLNGLTAAAVLSAANCQDSGPIVTVQSGDSYTHLARDFACDDGNYGTRAGGGTVSGNSLAGQMDTISQAYGYTGSAFVTGTVTSADHIALSQNRITSNGSVVGSCNFSPALSISVTIVSTTALSSQAGAKEGAAGVVTPSCMGSYLGRRAK